MFSPVALVLLGVFMACGSDGAGDLSADIDQEAPLGGDSLGTPDSIPDNPPFPRDSVPPSDSTLVPDSLPPPDSMPPSDSLPDPGSSRSGIPFGFFRQPSSAFGVVYTGAKQTVGPQYILASLQAARARGGRVFLMLADHEKFYKDARGHFSISKWKARIDRYKNIDFSTYVSDGTIVAHFMIDEPQDKKNWNGVPLTGAQLEEMAKYSKQLWPNLATVVRATPSKITWPGTYKYLDAAWAQVENVRGDLNIIDFLNQNVAGARKLGLSLVVGLNVSKGNLNRGKMTPAQINAWGSVLLSSPYPCAFINWQYDASYLSRSDVREAMASLAEKARGRASSSCRARSGG